MRTALDHPDVVAVRNMVAHEDASLRILIENVELYGVLPEEAELYAVASEVAYQQGGVLSRPMWRLAQYLGAEDFRTLGDRFNLAHSSGAVEDVKQLVDAGMEPSVLVTYPYDDDRWGDSDEPLYEASDVLHFFRKGVPGEYVSALGRFASLLDIVELHKASVPLDYAEALLSLMRPYSVLDCHRQGLPVEYALELHRV